MPVIGRWRFFSRSDSFNVSLRNGSKSCSVSQDAYVPQDVYVFTRDTTLISMIPASGGSVQVDITSTKNGATQSFSVTSKPDWLTVTPSNSYNYVTCRASRNTNVSTTRSGTVTLTQGGSNDTLSFSISQLYSGSISPTGDTGTTDEENIYVSCSREGLMIVTNGSFVPQNSGMYLTTKTPTDGYLGISTMNTGSGTSQYIFANSNSVNISIYFRESTSVAWRHQQTVTVSPGDRITV